MKTTIAVPCMEAVQTEFYTSCMEMKRVGEIQMAVTNSSLIYAARDELGARAAAGKSDFVLWLDSDVVFPNTLMTDLMEDMEGRDMVTGIYHMRRPPFKPVIWKKLRRGLTAEENETEEFPDYPEDRIFEVEGCGFGCVMMRTDVLRKVKDKFGSMFSPMPGYGEDLSFCIRARACGISIHCDPRVQLGHKGSTIIAKYEYDQYRKRFGDEG